MVGSPDEGHRGLLLPPGVVQPFLLHYRRDDLHVMAFFDAHPVYEAVEAMIQHGANGEFSIRAILTRHDQSQIDHINDRGLLARFRGIERDVHYRPIALHIDSSATARRARLEFQSHAGERVVLDIRTVGQPDARGSGVSDPGRHSPTSSLPLMWREASTLAGALTEVRIDDVNYQVPVKVRSGAFVAHHGYYTEGHAMGVIRAGAMTTRLLDRPDRVDVGAAWVFDIDGQQVIYRAVERDPDGRLRIARCDDSGETIMARTRGEQLEVSAIVVPTRAGEPGGLTLSFGGDAGFSLSVDGGPSLIAGEVDIAGRAEGTVISLCAAQPAWATRRAVRVTCSGSDGSRTLTTTIGEPPLDRTSGADTA